MRLSPPHDRRVGVYLDDCAFDYDLVAALETVGLRAVTPIDAGLLGARDERHLAYAAANGLPLLTKNLRDFAPPRGPMTFSLMPRFVRSCSNCSASHTCIAEESKAKCCGR